MGERIELQNDLGAWQRRRYECDFAPSKSIVLNARAALGRPI